MDPNTGRIYDKPALEQLERDKAEAKRQGDTAAAEHLEELQKRLVEIPDEELALVKGMSWADRRRWTATRRLEARLAKRGRP